MTADVTMKRRSSDWQQTPPTVSKPDAASWYQEDAAAVIEGRGLAHISMALSGAQAIAAILQQAALGRTEDDVESRLKLCGHVEQGLLAALSACLETVESHTFNVGASWTASTNGEDERQTVAKAVQSINVARYRKEAGRAA